MITVLLSACLLGVMGTALAEPAHQGSLGIFSGPIAFDEVNNRLYAASCGSWDNWRQSIDVYDGTTNALIDVIPYDVGYCGGEDLEVNPVTNKIYLIQHGYEEDPQNLVVISATTKQVLKVIPYSSATDLAINPATNRIYLNRSGNSIDVLDGSSDTTIASIDPDPTRANNLVDLAVNSQTNRIYVTDNWGKNNLRELHVLDGATNQQVGSISFPAGTGDTAVVAVNRTTNRIYMGSYGGDGRMWAIDGATNQILASLPVTTDLGVESVAVNEQHNRVYFGLADNWDASHLIAMDGRTNTIAYDYNTGLEYLGVAVNAPAHRLYVHSDDVWLMTEDATAPVSSFTTSQAAITKQVSGITTDDFAGVDQVTVSYTGSGLTGSVNAQLSCDPERRSCSWTASLPYHPGPMILRVSSVDTFGNTEPEGLPLLVTVF